MDTRTTRRIGDASAVAILATMAMTWLIPKGLGMIVSGGFSGFDLMSKFYQWLILVPIAALICLGILIYSEANPVAYESSRKSLAILRFLCALVGGGSVGFFVMTFLRYDPIRDGGLLGALIPLELGEGAWLNLIAFLVLAGEAFIDYSKP